VGSYSVQCARFNTPENNKLPQLVKRVVSCMEEATHQFSPFLPFISAARISTNAVTVRLTPRNDCVSSQTTAAQTVSYDCGLLQWATETTNANGNIQVEVCMRIVKTTLEFPSGKRQGLLLPVKF